MKLHLLLAILCIFTPVMADADPEHVEISTIEALWDGGDRDSALALIGTEMVRARAETDSSRLAALLLKEGAYHAAYGNYGHCEGVLAESVALAEALADSTVLIAALRWYGVSVSSLGRGEEGAAYYSRVLTLARILDDRPHEGWAQIGLSWYAWKQGDGDVALEGYHQAVDCFSGTEDLRGTLWALNGLATVQSGLGDYEAALESYHLSRDRARAGGRLRAEANALNDIGSMEFYLGMTDQALKHFERSLEIQSEQEISRQRIYPLFNIAICLNTQGRTREARETLTGAMATCAEQGYKDLEASAIINLAEILMNQGQLNEAELFFRDALGPDREPRLGNRITAHIGLSELLKRQDLDEAALAELEKASDLLDTSPSTLTWQRLRVIGHFNLLQTRLGRHRIALDSHLDLAEQAEEHGVIEFRFRALAHAAQNCIALAMPDSALLLYEEAASTWESVRQLLLDPDWRERRGSNGQMIYTDLAALMISRGETATAFDRIQDFKGRTLAERMLGPGSRHDRYLEAKAPSITLLELQQEVLKEDELFLDFHLGPKRSLLFAVSRSELRIRELSAAPELESRLRAYAELLASPEVASRETLRDVGGRLARSLFGEELELLGTKQRLLCSPDGALNLLPFAELPGCEERYWTRIPSASILRYLRDKIETREDPEHWKILAIASGTGEAGEALPGALRELDWLEARFRDLRSIRLTRDNAAFDPEELRGHDLLHLAAHAKRDDQNPWQSAIQFQPGTEGGDLRAAEITELQLDAGLAFLSSCGSGSGGILSGEGVLGLSSAFLVAGVPAVLATLWAVDDAATAYFVEFFYEALAQGQTCGQALLEAQDQMKADPETAHPYYWAGFVLIGEGGLKPELRARPGWLLPAAGLVTLMAIFIASRRRRKSL